MSRLSDQELRDTLAKANQGRPVIVRESDGSQWVELETALDAMRICTQSPTLTFHEMMKTLYDQRVKLMHLMPFQYANGPSPESPFVYASVPRALLEAACAILATELARINSEAAP